MNDSKTKGITYSGDPSRKMRWCYERRIDGRRYRTFFSSMEEAISCKRLAEKAMKTGADGRRIFDGSQQREYEAAKKILGGKISLVDAALFFRKHESLHSNSKAKVKKVVFEVLEYIEKRGSSKSFYSCNKVYLERFSKSFGTREVSTIRGREVSAWIAELGLSPRTLIAVRSILNYFFKRAKSFDYLSELPMIDKGLLPKVSKNPILTLSVAETRELMRAVSEKRPELVANFALRCFCGLRTAEATRMRWEWIDEERKRILIPAHICKTNDDWVLQSPALPETVFKWLATVPQESKHGKLPSPRAGVISSLSFDWKRNALRHTFCTNHISLENSADKTALLLRHRGTAMLYQHYLAKLVPHEVAKEYFAISPQTV